MVPQPAPSSGAVRKFLLVASPRADTIALLFQQVATVPLYYYTQTLLVSCESPTRIPRGSCATPTGGDASPLHQDLRKPEKDLQELCE